MARWVRVYFIRSQSTAPLSILPKVVGKNFETSEGPPSFMRCETMVGTEKRRRLISVGLHAINYKLGARSEITFFNRRAKRVKDVKRPSYDVVRHHNHRTTLPRDPTMMSASQQTIVVKSDLVRLSYDGLKMSDDFPKIVHTSKTHCI